MGKASKLYETSYGFYKIIVEDGVVTAILKKPNPNSDEKIKNKKLQKIDANEVTIKEETLSSVDIQVLEETKKQLQEFLNGERKEFNLPMNPKGTEFQKKVWAALCDIPYGETRTYKEIAIAIGNPKACRAVGMANNVNPIIVAIP